jgi:hypothetical protein
MQEVPSTILGAGMILEGSNPGSLPSVITITETSVANKKIIKICCHMKIHVNNIPFIL